MCPITRWGVIYVLVLKPCITLDKKVTKDFPDSFFQTFWEREKPNRSLPCHCQPDEEDRSTHLHTHSFWEEKRKTLMKGCENRATKSSELRFRVSGRNQFRAVHHATIHNNWNSCSRRLCQQSVRTDRILCNKGHRLLDSFVHSGQPYSSLRTQCSDIKCK